MKFCFVILLAVLGCGLACKETDLMVVEGMAVLANELRKGIKNIIQEVGNFNKTLLAFNATVSEPLMNYTKNHCLQKFVEDFEESLATYNSSELKIRLSDSENTYYKAIEGEIINKTSVIEEFAKEQKLNGSCYLENFGTEFSILTYILVHQINDSMDLVKEEFNKKLSEKTDSLRCLGADIKSELLKCNQNAFSEFCVAQFFSTYSSLILQSINITKTLVDVSNQFSNTLKSQQSDKTIELKYHYLTVKLSKCNNLK